MSDIPRLSLLTMINGLAFLVLGGLIGISMLWQLQGLSLLKPLLPLFNAHWFLMIYGFFLALIGNELLVVLSLEWSRATAINDLIGFFYAMLLASNILYLVGIHYLAYVVLLLAFIPLIVHVRGTYLRPSYLGMKPTQYNHLILTTLIITAIIVLYAASQSLMGGSELTPMLSLVFPVGTIMAILNRDLSLITGIRVMILRQYTALTYALIVLGILSMPILMYTQYMAISGLFLVAGSIMTMVTSGLFKAKVKGKVLSIVELITAFTWLAISGTALIVGEAYQWPNYMWSLHDIVIHTITLGFLFNVIFGVDVLLTDWLLAYVGTPTVTVRIRNQSIPKRLLTPYILLNMGIILRLVYDVGIVSWIEILSGVLSGLGILLFLGQNMVRIIINQRIKKRHITRVV